MKELIKREGGDERILLPAIYLHDIGYAGIIESEYTFEAGEDAKPDHMVKGALMARAVLEKTGGFSEDETYEICRLISIHDNLDEIKGRNAQLVFEADCLAQVDRDMVKPNFDKENYMKFIVNFRKRRVPLFRTKTGIYLLGKVMPKAEKYFD
jgi:CRISPR/Cas system-associated endonuclease Cas3-HD